MLLYCAILVPANAFILLGYLPDYQFTQVNIDDILQSHILSHLNLFSLQANPETGKLINDDFISMKFNIPTLAIAARSHNTQLMITLGGAGRSDWFFPVLKDKSKTTELIKSLRRFMSRNLLEGVDINWQYPVDSNQWNLLGKFIRLVKKNLPSITVSMAFYSDGIQDKYIAETQLMNHVDFASVMAYDHSLQSLPVVIDRWRRLQLPSTRLVLGIPLYSDPNGVNQPVPYKKLESNLLMFSRDVIERVQFSRREGLKGAMFWELGHDFPVNNSFSVIRLLGRSMKLTETTQEL